MEGALNVLRRKSIPTAMKLNVNTHLFKIQHTSPLDVLRIRLKSH